MKRGLLVATLLVTALAVSGCTAVAEVNNLASKIDSRDPMDDIVPKDTRTKLQKVHDAYWDMSVKDAIIGKDVIYPKEVVMETPTEYLALIPVNTRDSVTSWNWVRFGMGDYGITSDTSITLDGVDTIKGLDKKQLIVNGSEKNSKGVLIIHVSLAIPEDDVLNTIPHTKVVGKGRTITYPNAVIGN